MRERRSPLLKRREFVSRASVLVAASVLRTPATSSALSLLPTLAAGQPEAGAGDWGHVRAQFALAPRYLHFATFLLAAHPRAVREEIEKHRRGLDEDPVNYLHAHGARLEQAAREAAAEYLGGAADEVALTDSTTMGLGLLYGGLRLKAGQEIVATEHDFYSTHESLRLRARRTGTVFRTIPLYREPARASVGEIVDAVRRGITRRTRVLALTWVHSSTGVKLPIRQIADALTQINRERDEDDRVLLSVDGVHGLGVEETTVAALGCDFLISGCHKWLLGPRGTGLIWGRRAAWRSASATIPTFDFRSIRAWISRGDPHDLPPAAAFTPGGYHSFEHRWALAAAFRFHRRIGKDRVAARTRALSRQLKEGLASMRHVTRVTPMEERLSAGIVCFDVAGVPAESVVARLLDEHRIVASVTPYATRHVRLGPSILNSPEEVEQALRAISALR